MGLRNIAVRGGLYLVLRQGLGIVISVVGLILLTRILGPEAYGLWAAAYGIYSYISGLSRWGVDVYLIRRKQEPQPQDYNQAFSLLLLVSLVTSGLAILALPLLDGWVRLEGFGSIGLALFAGLPVALLPLIPSAQLERTLDYRKIALVELSGQTATYVVALPLAYQGLGSWAPVGGLWASQLLTLSLLYWISGYRPRFYWESARVRAMVRYGLGYSASTWIWELHNLVNPLVVSRYAGAEAVGYAALAIRIADQLSFVKQVAWRLSIAALSRLQRNRERLSKAVTEGMSFQIIAVGPFLTGFGLVAPWILPLFFGPRWLPVLEVYPFIALSYLTNAMFTLHSSALYVLQRNWKVAIFHLVYISLFFGSALLLV